MKKCNNCNALNDDDAVFCSKCGQKINETINLKDDSNIRKKNSRKGILNNSVVILLIMIVCPILGLLLMWTQGKFNKAIRIALSVIFGMYICGCLVSYDYLGVISPYFVSSTKLDNLNKYSDNNNTSNIEIIESSQKEEKNAIANKESETSADGLYRKQKDGFDINNCKEKIIGNYKFLIPNYWIESESEHYRAYAETGGKVSMLQIINKVDNKDKVSFDLLEKETNEGKMQSALKSWFEDSKFIDYEKFENQNLKGYIYNLTFKINEHSGIAKCLSFASESDNSWFNVLLTETLNTEYSYTSDFNKIISNITKVSENSEKAKLENELEKVFPKEYARRAIIYAISNSFDLDAFSDSDTYDQSKFHKYGDKTKYSMSLYKDGEWSYVDELTWHVEEFVLKPDNIKYITNYMLVRADVKKDGSIYRVLNCQHMWLSEPNYTSKTEPRYDFEDLKDEEVFPMINVPEDMLGDISVTANDSDASSSNGNSSSETKAKKKRGVFDDPDVKMHRFIDSMCEQQYRYGYKISGLSVIEVSDGVLDGKCSLRVKNSSGVWGNYSLHCVADFNKEKLITWDIVLYKSCTFLHLYAPLRKSCTFLHLLHLLHLFEKYVILNYFMQKFSKK